MALNRVVSIFFSNQNFNRSFNAYTVIIFNVFFKITDSFGFIFGLKFNDKYRQRLVSSPPVIFAGRLFVAFKEFLDTDMLSCLYG